MKIVHISQYYNDGYGYQENILPYYQRLLGHDVIHITSDRMSPIVPKNKRIVGTIEYEENGVRIIRLPIKSEFKGRFVLFKGLYESLEREKPDYIFHHGLTAPSLLECVKYKIKHGTFLVADNHADRNISGRYKIWLLGYYKTFWSSILRSKYKYIDLIFGVTPLRCAFASKYLSAPATKIRLLPIGADVRNVPREDRYELRRKYGFKDDEIIITTGGKITKNKRMEGILEAIKMLDSNRIRLVVFGNILDEDFKRKMEELRNVTFLGWLNRTQTLEILKLSDLAVWNTQHTTLIEDAVAAGTPLMLRYYGSTAHFINGNGLYLYSNTPKEIYDGIKLIVENPELLDGMRNAANKIKQILSYDNIAKESIEYYYDQSPKFIHKYFMNERFLQEDYEYYERIL